MGAFSAFAQLPNYDPILIPPGRYYLAPDEIQVGKETDGVNYQIMGNHLEIYVGDTTLIVDLFTEVEVVGNAVTFKSPKGNLPANYTYSTMEGIEFDNPAIPFKPGGGHIVRGLMFMQLIEDPTDDDGNGHEHTHCSNLIFVNCYFRLIN
jgi:hypothetical protein